MAHEVLQNVLDDIRRTEGFDVVAKPSHYAGQGAIECIDVLEQLGKDGNDFRALHAIKYLWRWQAKNGLEDLKKARWYLERLIAELEAA
jgi:hypothetical protein